MSGQASHGIFTTLCCRASTGCCCGYPPQPAIMAMEATAPPTFETLSAKPAVPPKIVCVMLGIRSILMMKAMKTIVQGIRFASHISIE